MATNKIPFDPANHEEFVAIRDRLHAEHRLGGSDIGTAAGVNKYKSRYRFYQELTGGIAVPDISNRQSIKDGILCEDLVAKKFEERTGKKVHRVNAIQTSDAAPHLFASIDRKVENEEAGLECKTANALNWDAFKNGKLPDSYVKQVQTYMKVTGYKAWYVYVWVMGCAEYCYLFTFDDIDKPEWCDTLVRVSNVGLDMCEDIAADFFALVDAHTPPEPDGSEDETACLRELFPESAEIGSVELTKVTEGHLDNLSEYKESIKMLEEKVAAIENAIKEEMGSHGEATVGSVRITWKNNKPSSKTDWKAVATEGGASDELISKHTEVKPGARVLRIGK